MKSLVLALSLLLSIPALAGHEGPEAAPVARLNPVIAKVVSGSGFVPPTVAFSTVVQIHADGQVERLQNFRGGVVKTAQLAYLAPNVTAQIAASAAAVVETKIEDPSPSDPGCTDAPSTTYYAVQGSKEIVIAQRESCKDMVKANESDADRATKRALNAALALSSLLP